MVVKRLTKTIEKKINLVILNHLKRLRRIQLDETVERVQSYLGGMKISFSEPVEERSTLYLELGNQSSGAFAYQIDEFLHDLAECCGDFVDHIFVIETEFDIRNKARSLATVAFHFNGKTLSEWCATSGEGLETDISTRQWNNANDSWSIVKAIHIRRLADGTSSVSVELPELFESIERVIQKNFGKNLVRWLKEDVRTSRFTMEPNEKDIQRLLDDFKRSVLTDSPVEMMEKVIKTPVPVPPAKIVLKKKAA